MCRTPLVLGQVWQPRAAPELCAAAASSHRPLLTIPPMGCWPSRHERDLPWQHVAVANYAVVFEQSLVASGSTSSTSRRPVAAVAADLDEIARSLRRGTAPGVQHRGPRRSSSPFLSSAGSPPATVRNRAAPGQEPSVRDVCDRALIVAPDWLLVAFREGKCKGLTVLSELRRLHSEHAEQVEAWASGREAITRESTAALRSSLMAVETQSEVAPSPNLPTAEATSELLGLAEPEVSQEEVPTALAGPTLKDLTAVKPGRRRNEARLAVEFGGPPFRIGVDKGSGR